MGNRTAKVLAVSAVWAPYLASSIFLFWAILAACGSDSLVLTAVAWLIGTAFAYFSTTMIIAEINAVDDSDTFLTVLMIFAVWMLLWLLETAIRKVHMGDNAMCTYSSGTVLFAWIASYVGAFFATQGVIYVHQRT